MRGSYPSASQTTMARERARSASSGTSEVRSRVAQLERLRRQELLTPAAISMIVLTISGYLPALRPAFQPVMFGALTGLILLFAGALLLNRANFVAAASATYIVALVCFYGVALFLTPAGSEGQLAISNFTAGNLYYFLADVLPIFASTLLLDQPWPIVVNAVVFVLNNICIFVLPHDATFDAFTRNLGGPLFLAASVTAGQFVLIVFGTAAAQTIRRALASASRATDLAAINARIEERQRKLDDDIQALQQIHARIANGDMGHITLQPNSELYPLGASLNLMVDRLSRLSREGQELRQIERGLAEASAIVNRMGQGDLTRRPSPTGTMVDGLLALLVQVQGQIGTFAQQVAQSFTENGATHQRASDTAAELVASLSRLTSSGDTAQDVAAIQSRAEELARTLHTVTTRERQVAEAISRIKVS